MGTMNIFWIFLAWLLISVPFALFAGAFIEAGKGRRRRR